MQAERYIATAWRLSLVFAAALACAQDPRTASISGRVLDKDTNQPIRKAVVTLNWLGTPRSWAMEQTDRDGQFRFTELPAGRYEMRANRPGYASIAYGAERPTQTGEIFNVAVGEAKTGLDIRLVHAGAIAGTVVDGDGDPLIKTQVTALAEMYDRGTRQFMPRAHAVTNEKGEYRFSNLEPGRYYVAARRFDDGGPSPPHYYGGTSDSAKAVAVAVGAGEVIRGIDLRLAGRAGAPLRGRVTGVPEQGPQTPVEVWLSVPDAPRAFPGPASQAIPPDYQFTFPAVSSGKYTLMAYFRSGDRRYRTVQNIEVGESESPEVVIALNAAVDLSGQVKLEGSAPEFSQRVRVELIPGDGLPVMEQLAAEAAADGKFMIRQVPPGVWDINVRPVPAGGYIKSMQLGTQDVLTEEMRIGPGSSGPLNIVVSARGAQVEGNVQAESEQRRSLIVLAPWGKFRHVASFFRVTMSDEKGHFELRGITPGEYRLFAFDDMKPQRWLEPGYLDRFEKEADKLGITEGAKASASPKRIVTVPPERDK